MLNHIISRLIRSKAKQLLVSELIHFVYLYTVGLDLNISVHLIKMKVLMFLSIHYDWYMIHYSS